MADNDTPTGDVSAEVFWLNILLKIAKELDAIREGQKTSDNSKLMEDLDVLLDMKKRESVPPGTQPLTVGKMITIEDYVYRVDYVSDQIILITPIFPA
jgi:hypothetical protein